MQVMTICAFSFLISWSSVGAHKSSNEELEFFNTAKNILEQVTSTKNKDNSVHIVTTLKAALLRLQESPSDPFKVIIYYHQNQLSLEKELLEKQQFLIGINEYDLIVFISQMIKPFRARKKQRFAQYFLAAITKHQNFNDDLKLNFLCTNFEVSTDSQTAKNSSKKTKDTCYQQ